MSFDWNVCTAPTLQGVSGLRSSAWDTSRWDLFFIMNYWNKCRFQVFGPWIINCIKYSFLLQLQETYFQCPHSVLIFFLQKNKSFWLVWMTWIQDGYKVKKKKQKKKKKIAKWLRCWPIFTTQIDKSKFQSCLFVGCGFFFRV